MAKRPTTRSKSTESAAPAAPAGAPKPKRTRAAAGPRAAEQTPAGPPAVEPSIDDIRRRAYERYQARGGNHGRHFDDWLEAEKELRGKK